MIRRYISRRLQLQRLWRPVASAQMDALAEILLEELKESLRRDGAVPLNIRIEVEAEADVPQASRPGPFERPRPPCLTAPGLRGIIASGVDAMGYPKGKVVPRREPDPGVVEFGAADLLPVTLAGRASVLGNDMALQVRASGDFAQRGFFLSRSYVWKIVQDGEGYDVLVPTLKR